VVYGAFGESPSVRSGNRAEGVEPAKGNATARSTDPLPRGDQALPNGSAPFAGLKTYDELFARAAAEAGDWRTLTLALPASVNSETVRLGIDRGNGGQPQLQDNLVLEAATGAVRARQPFSSQSPGQRTRSWMRFLHTGEALGIAGQIVASAASLATLVMIWTGTRSRLSAPRGADLRASL
jgi:uncharacterized iron-regulated membrane protein